MIQIYLKMNQSHLFCLPCLFRYYLEKKQLMFSMNLANYI
nr:MAG TPA: hypothetical protein [Bacteriophage sp.]